MDVAATKPMTTATKDIRARFVFKPSRADEFCLNGTQVVEMLFDDIKDVVEYCKEFESALVDCIVSFDGEVICASDFLIED